MASGVVLSLHTDLLAQMGDFAACTVRLARGAACSAVIDHLVTEPELIIVGDNLFKRELDFYGVVILYQTDAVGQTYAMRVNHNRRLFENIAQHEVCSLAPGSGKREQILHRIRHLAAVYVTYSAAAGDDILRFVLIKACRTDKCLQFKNIRVCVVLRSVIPRKQMPLSLY